MTESDATLSFCGRPPVPADLAQAWNLDPLPLAILVAVGAGLALATADAGRSRRSAAASGWLLLALLLVSPLCALGVALFSIRALHHLALVAAVAPLIALATPRRRPAAPAALVGATVVQAAVLWLWHAPTAYAAALSSDAAYVALTASLLASATWFWRLVAAPGTAPLAAVGALVASAAQMGLLGALLTFAPRSLYEAHLVTTQPFGLSPLLDQQAAGLLMWVGGLPVYAAVALALVARLLVRPAATA